MSLRRALLSNEGWKAYCRLCVDIRAAAQQQFRNRYVVLVGGEMKGRVAFLPNERVLTIDRVNSMATNC